MARKVFKYQVGVNNQIKIPADFKVVDFNVQNGTTFFWAEIVEDNPIVSKEFIIVGTGHEIPKDFVHCGTCHDSPFVWHLYVK